MNYDGRVVAMGAFGVGTNAGHVRVMAWDGGDWTQLGQDLRGQEDGDFAGYSVALSGTGSVVAVGAIYNDAGGRNAGNVRVFLWFGSEWVQAGADIVGDHAGDVSGASIALSSDGNVLAIGSIYTANAAGQVRVFAWSDNQWQQFGSDLNGSEPGDQFGRSAAMSADGTVVAVGAAYFDGPGGYDSGLARIFRWNGIDWSQMGADIPGDYSLDLLGRSVSLSHDGTVLAIGAPGADDAGTDSGQVRVYAWNGSEWQQVTANVDGQRIGDSSGISVSLSSDGRTLAVGSYLADDAGSESGRVRIYKFTEGYLPPDSSASPSWLSVHVTWSLAVAAAMGLIHLII